MSAHIRQPDADEVRSLLLRNWMTHDAMWFANSLERLGIEETNVLNRSAVRAMAAIEAKRIAKLFGLAPVTTAGDVRRFFDTAIATVIPDFMDFTVTWVPDETAVSFEITRCFAFEGVSALGVADRYECGVYERLYGWLDGLGVEYSIAPDTARCTRDGVDGACSRKISLVVGADPSRP